MSLPHRHPTPREVPRDDVMMSFIADAGSGRASPCGADGALLYVGGHVILQFWRRKPFVHFAVHEKDTRRVIIFWESSTRVRK